MGAVRVRIDRADFGFQVNSSRAFAWLVALVLVIVTPGPGRMTSSFARVVDAPVVSPNIVISEIRTRSGGSASNEFVEIFNRSSMPVNIGGYQLYGSNVGGVTSSRATVPAGTILQPLQHYLFANTGYSCACGVTADATYTIGIADDGGAAILNGTSMIDAVGFSTGSAYREGATLTPLNTTNINQSHERLPLGRNGQDTDDNFTDFLLTTSNPQNSSSPLLARLDTFTVTNIQGNTLIQWRSGYEIDNLGFNIYREAGGQRVKLNHSLVAGSALKGAGGASPAGADYTWLDDSLTTEKARYWLEDVDLNGTSTWHGPVTPVAAKAGQTLPAFGRSALLSEIGRSGMDAAHIGGTARAALARQPSQESAGTFDTQRWLASMPAARMPVRNDGWYRVSRQQLADAGFDTSRDPTLLQMYVDGKEVPIIVADWNVGSGGKEADTANGYIEFYGIGLDTPTTDTHVYWLANGAHPGRRILGDRDAPLAVSKPGAVPHSFPYTSESKPRTLYFSSLLNGDVENFFGPVISATPVDQTLAVTNRDTTEEQAQLEVTLQGVTSQAHIVSVMLNGVEVGVVNFMDREHPTATLPVDPSLLQDRDNIVSLVSTGGGSDVSLLDAISITYAHTYRVESNALTLTAQGGEHVRVVGFSSPQIRVFDVTDSGAPSEVEVTIEAGKGEFIATFSPQGTGTRTLLALTEDKVSRLTPVTVNVPSRWADFDTGADLLVIAHGSFIESVQPLVELRKSEGLSVAMVDVEDAYDEFSYGLHKPQAVKELLRWAHDHWLRVPRFVLLVGDASLDPRSYYSPPFRPPVQRPSVDLVPTKLIDTDNMETASDDTLADFDGDGLAEMAVGRLPARTAEEADKMVARIVGYRPGGAPERALLVADSNNGYDFEGATAALHDVIPGSVAIERVNRSSGTTEEVRARIIEGINAGPQVVSFFGHGNVDTWTGAGLLTSADAAQLQNRENLSLFVMMTCLNGYFQDPNFDSLGEALLKAPDGGAVAVWASSGMNLPDAQATMNRAFVQAIYSASSPTLGEAALEAKSAVSDPYARRTWVLLGDPSARIR